MRSKQKLELTWVGKENRPKLEPRILLGDPEKSYHTKLAQYHLTFQHCPSGTPYEQGAPS